MRYGIVENTSGSTIAADWWAGNKIQFPAGTSKVPLAYWYGMRRQHGVPTGVSLAGETDENGIATTVTYLGTP